MKSTRPRGGFPADTCKRFGESSFVAVARWTFGAKYCRLRMETSSKYTPFLAWQEHLTCCYCTDWRARYGRITRMESYPQPPIVDGMRICSYSDHVVKG